MKNLLTTLIILVCQTSNTQTIERSDFFANQQNQSKAPAAFILQKESFSFLKEISRIEKTERDPLVLALQRDPLVSEALNNWPTEVSQQLPLLHRIFQIQTKLSGWKAPELIIKEGSARGPAFFDFDLNQPDHPGRVLLNPAALKPTDHKFTLLSLLIHETRHSAQLQMSFAQASDIPIQTKKAFYAAFKAQKELNVNYSFCDFLTLNNEFEAFQFSNYILGKLTNWSLDLLDMGTFASQYNQRGELKIDLLTLSQVKNRDLIELFNQLEEEQYSILSTKD